LDRTRGFPPSPFFPASCLSVMLLWFSLTFLRLNYAPPHRSLYHGSLLSRSFQSLFLWLVLSGRVFSACASCLPSSPSFLRFAMSSAVRSFNVWPEMAELPFYSIRTLPLSVRAMYFCFGPVFSSLVPPVCTGHGIVVFHLSRHD